MCDIHFVSFVLFQRHSFQLLFFYFLHNLYNCVASNCPNCVQTVLFYSLIGLTVFRSMPLQSRYTIRFDFAPEWRILQFVLIAGKRQNPHIYTHIQMTIISSSCIPLQDTQTIEIVCSGFKKKFTRASHAKWNIIQVNLSAIQNTFSHFHAIETGSDVNNLVEMAHVILLCKCTTNTHSFGC